MLHFAAVDDDSNQLNESTEVNLTWTGSPFPTLRRERLTRRHMLEQIEGDGPSAQIALDKDEDGDRPRPRRAYPPDFQKRPPANISFCACAAPIA